MGILNCLNDCCYYALIVCCMHALISVSCSHTMHEFYLPDVLKAQWLLVPYEIGQ